MPNYVNLHTHTDYSMLDGHGKVDTYMRRAAGLGMDALAVTDHGNLHGVLDFYEAGKKYGVKPIIGIEAYQARKTRFNKDDEERASSANDDLSQSGPLHLTVLARNNRGYRNLVKLSSESYLQGFYVKARIDHELINQYADGLIILSGCLNGEVPQHIMRDDMQGALRAAGTMQDIVGKDNYYIEVMDHGISEEKEVLPKLLYIAEKIGAPVVATGDCHYVRKEDSVAHDLLLCVSTGAQVDEEDRFKFVPEEFYLRSYDEMVQRFDKEWLKNTLAIAESVEVTFDFGDLHFPSFPIPADESVDEFLERRVWEGIAERYGNSPSQEVRDRVKEELRVVRKMGFQEYFLVVSDLVRWAVDNGIRTGWGRGSAAGSILSFALRITNLDPLRFGLLFERFLVEGRKSMPDIDLDFDDRYRDKVIEYARDKYGDDRVAHICTFSEIKARSAIRDAARVLGYDYSTGDRVAKKVPAPKQGFYKSIEESLESGAEFKQLYESDTEAKHIIDSAHGLEGVYRQTGIHAAGVVIAPDNVSNYIPVMQKPESDGSRGTLVTQWGMEEVERCGLLKMDFLGLRNLGVIDMCLNNVKESRGVEIDPEDIPLDDELTYRKLCDGNSLGIFQLESPGMREMMVALQPRSIDDIAALNALYRPGPLGSGMDKLFIARRHGRAEVKVGHPILKDLLSETYGLMLYQEDVLNVARKMAGFTAGESDDLRKAMGKKLKDKIGLFREKFVSGAKRAHNVDPKVANKIYSDIEYFGAYGFNKSHAASYAMVSYVTAYLKFHYPTEYMAALLTSVGTKDKATPYLNECRNMGINVLPPSINRSHAEFKVESENEILFGLSSIDGVGPSVVGSILESRGEDRYTSIYDFMRRCNPDLLNKSTLEHLIRSGAFDELAPNQEDRPLSRDDKRRFLSLEKDELGAYVTENPLIGVWNILEPSVTTVIDNIETLTDGVSVTIGGLMSRVVEHTTKRGDLMYKLHVEDLTGGIMVLVFPRDAKGRSFSEGDIVLLEGRVAQEGDDEHTISKLFFSDVTYPKIPQYGTGEPIEITCISPPSYDIVSNMEDLIRRHPGDSPVYLEFRDDDLVVSLRFNEFTNKRIEKELQTIGKTSI